MNNFPGPSLARKCLNINKNGFNLQYSECSPLQKIQREAMWTLAVQKINLFTYGLCIHAETVEAVYKLFSFRSLLSRIFFQNFPGPEIFKKKIQDFPGLFSLRGAWEPCSQ